ncbi:MAG TPA: spore coat protein CotJB [Clostridium sp.]
MDKNDLMESIMHHQFYAIDLNLYLDNFPECENAKRDYKEVSMKLSELMCMYEEKYGQLTNFGSAYDSDTTSWTQDPWPWERKIRRKN